MNKCGFVAIVGRPNVGKSTLLNRILGQKISITSRKPQTTRHRILGIKTAGDAQVIYVDTPGLHKPEGRAINRYMIRTASQSLIDADVVVFVIEAGRWSGEDDMVLEQIKQAGLPTILVLNKIDRVANKEELLPRLAELANKWQFTHLVPLSAQSGANIGDLEKAVTELLPEGEPIFPPDQITNRSERFLAAEIVREKLTRHLGQELPYAVTVEIEQFKEEKGMYDIAAVIWVERDSQKAIVIGKKGEMLKRVGTEARQDMERLFGIKVYLQLWAKVKEGWTDDARALRNLGYEDET